VNTVYLGNETAHLSVLHERSNLICTVAEPIPEQSAHHFGSALVYARERSIPTMSPEAFLASPLACDLMISVGFGRWIAPRVIAQATIGAVNVHYSLLPAYRGRHPLNWAIINGERQIGVTLHRITDRIDAGRVIAQQPISLDDEDDIMSAYAKCVALGERLLRRVLSATSTSEFEGTPQDESRASYYRPRRSEDGLIDWTRPARDIANLVRALTNPYPGAYFYYRQRKIVVDEARCVADNGVGEIGVPVTMGRLYRVRTGLGALLLTRFRVQPSGLGEALPLKPRNRDRASPQIDQLGVSS